MPNLCSREICYLHLVRLFSIQTPLKIQFRIKSYNAFLSKHTEMGYTLQNCLLWLLFLLTFLYFEFAQLLDLNSYFSQNLEVLPIVPSIFFFLLVFLSAFLHGLHWYICWATWCFPKAHHCCVHFFPVFFLCFILDSLYCVFKFTNISFCIVKNKW